MTKEAFFKQQFKIAGGDFVNGGDASCKVGNILKELGIDADTQIRVMVAAFEAEMNVVIYAQEGTMDLCITGDRVLLTVEDRGPGIENIRWAMQPGFSTATEAVREMGFGAGMGLPNIEKNTDVFNISSEIDKGTRLEMIIDLPESADNDG